MGTPHRATSLTAVIDIGKTKTALVLVTADGEKVHERSRACAVVGSELGYSALDTAGTEAWLRTELAGLGPIAASLRRIIVTTHGAAIAALRNGALQFPVPDYEWAGFDDRPDALSDSQDFAATLSPLLPCGLNMGVQLDWIERHHPQLLADAETLLPYPQYWAWWLCGVATSEVSSLGCHTLLWEPKAQSFSDWAESRGWAYRFAPMRKAWETLGRRLGTQHLGSEEAGAAYLGLVPEHYPAPEPVGTRRTASPCTTIRSAASCASSRHQAPATRS